MSDYAVFKNDVHPYSQVRLERIRLQGTAGYKELIVLPNLYQGTISLHVVYDYKELRL